MLERVGTMAARSPEQILNSIAQKQGRGAAVRRKLTANKERNWMLALTLKAFAKLADNEKLTDLDQTIVNAYKKNGFTDAELKVHGKLAKGLSQQVRDEIFPQAYARLDAATKAYALKDLERDADGIVKRVLTQRNVNHIDVHGIHAGRANLRDFPSISRATLAETGSEMMVATESAAAPANGRYTIKATSFRCNDRQTDSVFGPSNEPYWIFGSLGNGTAVTTRSQEFGDVDNGETRTFASGEGCIWGQNCSAQTLPEGEVGSLVALWEHDEGNKEDVRKGVAAAFAAAAGILAATGVAAWVAAVVAGVGGVVQWLLGFLDDDHIADQTFVFTRDVVQKQIPNVGQSFIVTRRFTDGDGDYTLTLKVTHAS